MASNTPPERPLCRRSAGFFLTFEGPEGAGKTTQIARLEAALVARGQTVTRTREPGGDAVGKQVRFLTLGTLGGDASPTPEAELLLFAAARAQNVALVIRPALAAGHVVLCDRFTDSTRAYQGAGRGLSEAFIAQINAFATGGLLPDQTFLLDLPPALGLSRQNPHEQDRLDRENLAFHERVRQGFLDVAAREPGRVLVVDAARSPNAVFADVLAATLALLGGDARP